MAAGTNGGKMTVDQALREGHLSFDDMVRAAKDGIIDTRKKYAPDELRGLLAKLNPLVSGGDTDRELYSPGSDTYLVKLRLPGTNLIYITLMREGKVLFTKDLAGGLDLSNPREGMDDVLDVLAWTTMFDPTRRQAMLKAKGRKGGKGGKKKQFKPTKAKPGYVRDPLVDRYFADNADPLAFYALSSGGSFKKGQVLRGRDDLEALIADEAFLGKAEGLGLEIEVESVTSYVASNRGAISSRARRVIDTIIEKQEVRSAAGRLLAVYIEKDDRERRKLRKLCESPNEASPIYKALITERDKTRGEDKGEHYVIAFRELALRVILEMSERGKRIPRDELDKYISSTRRWVALAKAADYVRTDRYVQDRIIPDLRDISDEESARDRIFNAVCKVGKLVVDPDHLYDTLLLRFVVEGLWMEGLMMKVGGKERTPHGASVEFTDGMGNLVERYSLYDRLLRRSFDKLLSKGEFDDVKEIYGAATCLNFGERLYDALLDRDKKRFARLRDEDVPLTMGGTYLGKILRAYVGINREEFLEAIEKKREKGHAKEK